MIMFNLLFGRLLVVFSVFFLMIRRPPRSTRTDTLFPTRRSSDLVAGSERKYLAERIQRRIGPDHRQGERVMAMLGDWVRDAAENPDDPESFTQLFLADMARLQDIPVALLGSHLARSEERRVGKEGVRPCRSRWSAIT